MPCQSTPPNANRPTCRPTAKHTNNTPGPPGVGKTHAVREAARRALSERGLRVHVQVINGGELAAEGNGSDVEAVQEAFLLAGAATFAGGGYHASLLFFDEMDALCPAGDGGAFEVS